MLQIGVNTCGEVNRFVLADWLLLQLQLQLQLQLLLLLLLLHCSVPEISTSASTALETTTLAPRQQGNCILQLQPV